MAPELMFSWSRFAKFAIALFATCSAASFATELPDRLNLSCSVSGTIQERRSGEWSGTGDWTTHGSLSETVDSPFNDKIQLWIERDGGEIRLPSKIRLVVGKNGNGWFKLSKIKISDKEIISDIKLGILDRAKIIINRISGNIFVTARLYSSDSTGANFGGSCMKFDPITEKREF